MANDTFSKLAAQGIFYQPIGPAAKPAEEDGDFVRGVKKSMYQIPQTAGGALALVGDAVGSDGLRDYGLNVYQKNEDKIQAITKPSDSLSTVLEGEGDGVDWLQNTAGYTAGQAASALLTGGAGAFVGRQIAMRGIGAVAARAAESAAARQVAAKVAAKGVKYGAGAALGANNLVQEAGSIYPDAVRQAQEEGRTLDGGDLARVAGSAVAAAAVDTGMDAFMAGRLLHGGRRAGEGIARAAVREVPGMAAKEAVTEGVQTGIERFGAGQQLSTADAIRDYVDSIGVGAVGGGMGGAVAALHAQKIPETGPLTRAANATIDNQILQLQYDPQPLISFPDGSVGTKAQMEQYLLQFPEGEERTAKRRELVGRDPSTGKSVEQAPQQAEEPAYAADETTEANNLKAWTAEHEGVPLDYAHSLQAAPGMKGKGMMIAPHPDGGFTLVPSNWLTLDTQAKLGELQKPAQAGKDEKKAEPKSEPAPAVEPDYWKANPYHAYKFAMPDLAAKFMADKGVDPLLYEVQPAGDQFGIRPKGVTYNPSGQPFMSEFAAKRKMKERGDTHDIAKVDDGWVLVPKAAAVQQSTEGGMQDGAATAVPANETAVGGQGGAPAAGPGPADGNGPRDAGLVPEQQPAVAAPAGPDAAIDPVHATGSADAKPALTDKEESADVPQRQEVPEEAPLAAGEEGKAQAQAEPAGVASAEKTVFLEGDPDYAALEKRAQVNDAKVDALTGEQVEVMHESMGLKGGKHSVEAQRAKIKEQHPDDVEAALAKLDQEAAPEVVKSGAAVAESGAAPAVLKFRDMQYRRKADGWELSRDGQRWAEVKSKDARQALDRGEDPNPDNKTVRPAAAPEQNPEIAAQGERAAMDGYAMSPPSSVRKKVDREAWEAGWLSGKRKRDALTEGKQAVTVGDRKAVPVVKNGAVVWRDEGAGKDYRSAEEARAGLDEKVEADRRFDAAMAATPSREKAKPKALQERDAKVAKRESKPLDHGELNIPGRLKNIDRELDKHKAEKAAEAKTATKARAVQNREDKARAKALHAEHATAMLDKYGPKFDRKELAKEFDSMVKWEPAKFIKLAEKFASEQAVSKDTAPAAESANEDKDGDLRASTYYADKTVEVDGQRRPIVDSEGNLIAPDFNGQVEFWKNFKGKVDEKGRPIIDRDIRAAIAYHGTPYRFDKFTLDHIGKGEGNQAFGWGLYFAGEHAVADYYRTALSGLEDQNGAPADMSSLSDPAYNFIQEQLAFGTDIEGIVNAAEATAKQSAVWDRQDVERGGAASRQAYIEAMSEVAEFMKGKRRTMGQVYEVAIPERDTMLHWDVPFSDQPQHVKDAFAKATGNKKVSDLIASDATGEAIVRAVGKNEAGSKYLHSLGIDGIAYLNGASRGAGNGEYNYVVFDDAAIRILKTYHAMKWSKGGQIDQQLASMVKEGASVDSILQAIEEGASTPEFRTLAKQLRAQNLKTGIVYGRPNGTYAGGVDASAATASYRESTDTAYLHQSAGATQLLLHELSHAATLKALARGGLAAQQVKELFNHVKNRPLFSSEYGITNPEEFVAEAFTSPAFRKLLANTPAPGKVMSAWDKFVGIVRRILGLPVAQDNMLARVMALQSDLMAENQGAQQDATGERLAASVAHGPADQLRQAMGNGINAATLTDLPRKFKNRLADFRGIGLQALGRRQIVDIYADDFKPASGESILTRYSKIMQQMDADKNEAGAEADSIADRWGKLKDGDQLADLMHDSTLAQIDPDKDYVAGDNRAEWSRLKNRLNGLSPEARAIYKEARDAYHAHWQKVRAEIRGRIERSLPDSPRRADLLAKMDATFYEKVKGVYFPLARFGDYVVTVQNAAGERVSVNFAETLNEAEALRKSLLRKFPPADGNVVSKVTKKKEFNPGRDAVSRGFMTELHAMLDQYDESAELRDDINQLYLQSMPDLSWAKHGIHRKGTPGFSQDARRAFAQNMFHGARYLAKLRYADRLGDLLTDMQDHVDGKASDAAYDSVQAQQVVDEMNKRHQTYMSPNTNPLSSTLTSLGFIFYLGLSPASAAVNLSQTPLVTLPMLAAKHGFAKASAALLRASKEAAANRNDISKALRGDELRAFNEAVNAGVIDVSMAHDLAGIAAGDDTAARGKMRPIMKWASFMFHHGEKFNRQATLLAAYRLAREAGQSHEHAYETAVDDTYKSHFDYSSGNRARVMQGDVARVVLLFKQYGQNMIYSLARNAVLAAKGDKVALKTFAGLLLSHSMAAGVLGLPVVGTLLSIATALGGDDDDPWDARVALRNMLADLIGQKPAEVMMHGFSRLTPFDISGRVGLDKLILPDVQEGLEGSRAFESWMTAALGPVAGIGLSTAKGLQDIAHGDVLRGLEGMMPVSIRNPLKALRYVEQGARDKTGIPIVDDTSAMEELGQLIGFSPSRVREATEGKSAVYQAEHHLNNRRQALVEQWAHARMAGDEEGVQEAQEHIKRFNERNPTRQIKGDQLSTSLRNRNKRIREAHDGLYLPKKHADVRDLGRFAGQD